VLSPVKPSGSLSSSQLRSQAPTVQRPGLRSSSSGARPTQSVDDLLEMPGVQVPAAPPSADFAAAAAALVASRERPARGTKRPLASELDREAMLPFFRPPGAPALNDEAFGERDGVIIVEE
jgi:hypothetical protein